MAASSLVARSPHPLGEFVACFSLCVHGVRSPDKRILFCRGACRRGVDAVGFRTLGSGTARDAKLGARPHEAMALGGVIWGWTAAIAGSSYTLLGAAVLFLTSLLLTRRLSINFAESLAQRVSGHSSTRVEPRGVAPIALTTELLAA